MTSRADAGGGERRAAARALIDAVVGALAPAWSLFVSAAAVPLLQWRAGRSADALGPWRAALAMTRAAPRYPWHLLHNADENARLATCSLVDRLADDAQRLDADDVAQGVTLALVRRLVAREVADAGLGPAFQLRVVVDADERAVDDDDTLLLAPVDDVDAALAAR